MPRAEVLSTHVLHRCRIFAIVEQGLRLPSGRTVTRQDVVWGPHRQRVLPNGRRRRGMPCERPHSRADMYDTPELWCTELRDNAHLSWRRRPEPRLASACGASRDTRPSFTALPGVQIYTPLCTGTQRPYPYGWPCLPAESPPPPVPWCAILCSHPQSESLARSIDQLSAALAMPHRHRHRFC
jgi:hypothetical protein